MTRSWLRLERMKAAPPRQITARVRALNTFTLITMIINLGGGGSLMVIGDNDMDLGDDHELVFTGTAVNGNHIGQKIRERLMKETFVMGITTNSLPYNSTSSPSIVCNCFPLI